MGIIASVVGVLAGVFASVVALAAIGWAKLVVIEIAMSRAHAQAAAELSLTANQNEKAILADQLTEEFAKGKMKLSTEPVTVPCTLRTTKYPKNLWDVRETRWTAMPEAPKECYRATFRQAQ